MAEFVPTSTALKVFEIGRAFGVESHPVGTLAPGDDDPELERQQQEVDAEFETFKRELGDRASKMTGQQLLEALEQRDQRTANA